MLSNLFKRKEKFLAAIEYWVFLPTPDAPSQDDVMTQMVSKTPHARPGVTPIGPREGIMFSDIRLNVTVALRDKNPHAFRPDLFDEQVEPDSEVLASLAEAQAFVRLRFISDEPLKDDRHLQFLPHMADAVATLGKATAVYDVSAKRLMLPEELSAALTAQPIPTSADFHVLIKWHRTLAGGYAQTSGLIKVGVPELKTNESPTDQQVIVMEVLHEAVKQIWADAVLPDQITVDCYDDTFTLDIKRERHPPHSVHISRMQVV